MADNTTPTGGKQPSAASKAKATTKALQPDPDITIPRVSLKETGFAALRVTSQGAILEQANMQFRFPQMIRVVEEMMYNPVVATGLSAINTLMCRAEVTIKPLLDETPTEKARRLFLMSVLDDMDNSWQATMQSIATCLQYGHQISEMVFRRRLNRNGSKFNDGFVGLAGLKNRPQNSVARWNFAKDGRSIDSISQSIRNMPNGYEFVGELDEYGYIEIPREKFILFRCDPVDDSPQGRSVLIPAYLAYKQLTLLTDHLMTGAAKNLGGVPFAQLPPKYLDPNAAPEDAAVFTAVQNIISNLQAGQSSGIIFPKMLDDAGNELFDFTILEQKTGNVYNLESIIKLLQSNILYVLGCGSISMGAVDGGSLSLQDANSNLLALTVAYRLSEIANTMNKELVPRIWALNGWDTSRMPSIGFKDISTVDIETFTKGIQRLASTSMLEVDRGVMNKICEVMGFPLKPEDAPVDREILSATLTGQVSSASEGMEVGTTGEGTSTNAVDNGQNASDNNADNK